MADSADTDQLASSDLHCLQRQGISGFSRTRVKEFYWFLVLIMLHVHSKSADSIL